MRIDRNARAANQAIEDRWIEFICSPDHRERLWSYMEDIASSQRDGMRCKLVQKRRGAFNYCFTARFDDDEKWIFRFPIPGSCMHPVHKTQREVHAMRFIKEKTAIPVPRVITTGVVEGLGPYILMECVNGTPLDELLLDFEDENQRLRKDIDDSTLRHIYRQIADVHLELFSHDFPAIGSLILEERESERIWRVDSEPLTLKINEVQRLGGVELRIANQNLDSAAHYLKTVTAQSLTHLTENDTTRQYPEEAIEEFNYIRLLQSMSQHFANKIDNIPYKLFCDDLRFGNILVNDSYDIVAIIDWEFTYVAPASFLGSPPWWLTGTEPFEWNEEDERDFHTKLQMFLTELEKQETTRGETEHTLSRLMWRCMIDGTFWYNMAIRESTKLVEVMRHCVNTRPFCNFQTDQALESDFSRTARLSGFLESISQNDAGRGGDSFTVEAV